MSVEMKDLVPGAVAVDERGNICVVTEVHPERPAWPLVYAVKASGSAYKGRPESFKAVVGKVDLDAFKGVSDVPLFGCPEALKGLKAGDRIKVNHGFRTVEAVYGGYNYNRPKYPVSYELNGKRWKGPVSVVLGKVA